MTAREQGLAKKRADESGSPGNKNTPTKMHPIFPNWRKRRSRRADSDNSNGIGSGQPQGDQVPDLSQTAEFVP
jgi:hypothetical protein